MSLKKRNKSYLLALVLGTAIFTMGTALASNSMHPLSIHDAEAMSGGVTCFDEDGTCEITDWCDTSSCPTGPRYCDLCKKVEKSANDIECEVSAGYEDWECGVDNYGECAKAYYCVWDDDDGCIKGSYAYSNSGMRSCSAHPK